MYVKSEKIKVADVETINYVDKDTGEAKQLHKIEVGDINTGITEELLIPKDRIDIIKDIKKGEEVIIELKNRRGRFDLYQIIKVTDNVNKRL